MGEQTVVIVGAGGKMGARAAQKIGNGQGWRMMCRAMGGASGGSLMACLGSPSQRKGR